MTFAFTTPFRRKRRDTAGPETPTGFGTQASKRPLGGLQPAHLLMLR
ncbi:MAG: hypothetical protein KDK10_08800 [Maritimibacter sp.]|nr:hypothetical protein [Maritimibacter sp.]